MIFNSIKESDEYQDASEYIDPIDDDKDPDSAEGVEAIAAEVEDHMQQSALESVSYFENGDKAVKNFLESTEVQNLCEANSRYMKNTYVRLNKNDDLQRRTNLAALVIAREKNDILWKKLADNRVKERKLRQAIYRKYGRQAEKIAKKSQIVHIKNARKLPALPRIQ